MSGLLAILGKDLRIELRAWRSLAPMALFSATVFVIFRFALDRERLEGGIAAGVLVTTLLFASLLAINRIFISEREEGGFDLIRLSPCDPSMMFLAKTAALTIYLILLELIAVPLFALFFLDSAEALPALAPVLVLAALGLAAVGALISTIATMSSARDLLAPLLLLPLSIPLVIAAAGAASPVLEAGGPGFERYGTWLAVLGLYDVIFCAIGFAVFDYLLDE
jgi:heme exporter protein B